LLSENNFHPVGLHTAAVGQCGGDVFNLAVNFIFLNRRTRVTGMSHQSGLLGHSCSKLQVHIFSSLWGYCGGSPTAVQAWQHCPLWEPSPSHPILL